MGRREKDSGGEGIWIPRRWGWAGGETHMHMGGRRIRRANTQVRGFWRLKSGVSADAEGANANGVLPKKQQVTT